MINPIWHELYTLSCCDTCTCIALSLPQVSSPSKPPSSLLPFFSSLSLPSSLPSLPLLPSFIRCVISFLMCHHVVFLVLCTPSLHTLQLVFLYSHQFLTLIFNSNFSRCNVVISNNAVLCTDCKIILSPFTRTKDIIGASPPPVCPHVGPARTSAEIGYPHFQGLFRIHVHVCEQNKLCEGERVLQKLCCSVRETGEDRKGVVPVCQSNRGS